MPSGARKRKVRRERDKSKLKAGKSTMADQKDPVTNDSEKMKPEELLSLKRSRSALKGRVTIALGDLDIAIADEDVESAEAQIETAKTALGNFAAQHKAYHEQIILTDVDADIATSQAYYISVQTEVTSKIKDARSWISDITSKSKSKQYNSTGISDNSSNMFDSNVSGSDCSTKDLVDALSAPHGTLTKFAGDPLNYLAFMNSYKECIEDKIKDPGVCLSRLIEYTSGIAHEAVKMCAAIGGAVGLDKAKKILKSRFGTSQIIGRHVIAQLKDGGQVSSNSTDIVQLSNDLSCAQGVLASLNMSHLATEDLVRDIIMRCPMYLQTDWRKMVFIYTRSSDEAKLPNFEYFVKYIENKAQDASNLLYGNENYKPTNVHKSSTPKSKTNSKFGAACFSTAPTPQSQAKPKTQMRGRASSSNNVASSNSNVNAKCPMCKENHRLFRCSQFIALSIAKRKEFARNNGLCFNCFRDNHKLVDCLDPTRCRHCQGMHNSLLHHNSSVVSDQPSVGAGMNHPVPCTNGELNASSCNTTIDGDPVFLPMVVIKVNEDEVYCLIDKASSISFITNSLANRLGIRGTPLDYNLLTIAGCSPTNTTYVEATLSNIEDTFEQKVSNLVLCDQVPGIYPSVRIDCSKHAHLQGVTPHAIPAGSRCDVLLGADNSFLIGELDTRKSKDKKFPLNADLYIWGWAFSGCVPLNHKLPSSQRSLSTMTNCYAPNPQAPPHVADPVSFESLWEMQETKYDESEGASIEDEKVRALWDATCSRDGDSYVLPIPVKEKAYFPNNRPMALMRLISLKSKLDRTGGFEEYDKVLQSWIDAGHLKYVPEDELHTHGPVNYVPHYPVVRPATELKPKKTRPVLDAKAKYKGVSINTECMQGPNYLNKIFDVLTRFRQFPYAISGDISNMYLNVKVPEHQQDLLRILWYKDNSVVELRATCHVFGTIWAGSAASYALLRTVQDHPCEPLVQNVVKRNFYVDDGLPSMKTFDEAKQILTSLPSALSKGSFPFKKILANREELIPYISPDDRAPEFVNLIPETISKALGIIWEVKNDKLVYRFISPASHAGTPVTQRIMMSYIPSNFDPIGFIACVLTKGKILFQKATKLKLGWDTPLPQSLQEEWNAWLLSLKSLDQLSFERCMIPEEFIDSPYEMHIFCDASTQAYGAVAYLRMINAEGKIHVSLIGSKSRLSPIKAVSLPRLELCGAVLAVQLNNMLYQALDVEIVATTYWTDSKIVLAYLQNDTKRFKTFVSNRVAEIRRSSEASDWHWISGTSNPADILSRGCNVEDLPHSWHNGPDFLWQYKSEWSSDTSTSLSEVEPHLEVIKEVTANITTEQVPHPIDKLAKHYSGFHRLKKAICYLIRYRQYLKTKSVTKGPISCDELRDAEFYTLQHVQAQAFMKEKISLTIKGRVNISSPISRLSPFISKEDGLIHAGSRLSPADVPPQAVILPKSHRVCYLIAYDQHNYAHLGVEWCHSRLRERGYCILKVRPLLKSIRWSCVTCKKIAAKPMAQQMAPLPAVRCQPSRPFKICGVDVFGIFRVKVGRASVKRYACMFSCFSSRAIHIEKLDHLTASSLINALVRFSSRRGQISRCFSDNGTNMTGADRELRDIYNEINRDAIKLGARRMDIQWEFTPPKASHMAGATERMIGVARRVLAGIFKDYSGNIDDETLVTALCECENIVNSRPLTKCSEDILDDRVITPNHILLLHGNHAFPWARASKSNTLHAQWKHAQFIADMFWKKWIKYYLPELHSRQKWLNISPNLKVGDIVMMLDKIVERGSYPMARVIEVKKGRDGLVRSARLQTKTSPLVRPIHKLVLLEADLERN